MAEKDYSLLRPFDLEAAKAGAPIVCAANGEPLTFIAGPDSVGYFVAADKTGCYRFNMQHAYSMAPICWVECRPVYAGDVLYWKPEGRRVVVKANKVKVPAGSVIGEDNRCYSTQNLTWTPPKVKSKFNVVAFIDDQGLLRWVREDIFEGTYARFTRVPSEDKVIEVEL